MFPNSACLGVLMYAASPLRRFSIRWTPIWCFIPMANAKHVLFLFRWQTLHNQSFFVYSDSKRGETQSFFVYLDGKRNSTIFVFCLIPVYSDGKRKKTNVLCCLLLFIRMANATKPLRVFLLIFLMANAITPLLCFAYSFFDWFWWQA